MNVRGSTFLAMLIASSLLGLPVVLAAGAARASGPPQTTAPAGTDERDETLTEQSFYIPYEKLREIFEKQGRGVFLPYEEFAKLWRLAREKQPPKVTVKPPVEVLIAEIESEATVSEDVVKVSAKLKIEVLTEGWKEVPLRLSDAAITRATIGDEPARVVFEPGAGHKLLIEKKSKEPELIELSLEYVKAFAKSPGQNSVSFESPQAPVSRWRVRIPEPGVKVQIRPLIAATEVPEKGEPGKPADETVVLAFVGAAPTVQIEWTPKAEGATGLEALASVRTEQQVRIEEGVTRTRARLSYEISRAELSQLLLEVPADQKIVNVFDANVRQWSVEAAGGLQRITVQLFEPARGTQNVTVELEQFREDAASQELTVPVVKAFGVGRQQGLVVVQVSAGLRAEALRHGGLMQIDASELPEALAKQQWTFSYRYGALPFDLVLQLEKVQPRIVADTLVEACLEPERLTLNVLAVYQVERAGVFRFELDIPAGYEVRRVYGREAPDTQAVQVDTHYLTGDDKTHLVVNLSRKAFGRVGLAVALQKKLTEPALLSPTGETVELPLGIPQVAPASVERATGRVMVYAPESLRVNPGRTEGLRSVSFQEALDRMAPAEGRPPETRPVLAFAYSEQAVALELAVERRKPQVTARQLLVVRIESGVVHYGATFNYDVRYSGVKSLRIDVPADLADEIRNTTSGVREKVITPRPEDLPEGYVAWGLTGETEFMGAATIRLSWEHKMEELEVGKSVELVIPHLRPAELDRAWGQIVLTKTETMDVHETGEPKGVRPIDPQHDLMDGQKVAGAARAFEFHDVWTLTVTVTRYQLEEVKRTSIERAVVQMVATRSDQISVQALYHMRSARQRLAIRLPGGVEFDREPLRINGQGVSLERGEKDNYFVPLVGQNPDEPFLLELRYTVSGKGLRMDLPSFPSEPAVQKVYLCAYLPEELAYLGSLGPWSDELSWRWQPMFDHKPFPLRSHGSLVGWVIEGIKLGGSPVDTFQTDGRMYLFSALRPAPPPDGSLRLAAMDEDTLNIIVFALIVACGLALVRARAAIRWLVAGGLVVVLVLLGVFFPTFSIQIMDGYLVAAACIVLILWLLQYMIWARPKDPALIARRQAREQARLARLQARAVARAQPPQAKPPAEAKPPTETPADQGGEKNQGDKKNEGGSSDA